MRSCVPLPALVVARPVRIDCGALLPKLFTGVPRKFSKDKTLESPCGCWTGVQPAGKMLLALEQAEGGLRIS